MRVTVKLNDIPDTPHRCPECEYDLSGSIAAGRHQCPDCGFEFELQPLVSPQYHWQRWRKDTATKLMVLVLKVILAVTALLLLWPIVAQ